MQRITIKDIAKLANVTPSTVSRALNNKGNISEAISEKIKRIAQDLNYTINTHAVNFKNKKSNVIKLIIPEIISSSTPQLIKGVSDAVKKKKYRLSIIISDDSYENELEYVQNSIANNVDGILISLTSKTESLVHLEFAKNYEIPIIIIERTISDNNTISEVLFDDYRDGRLCAEYLKKMKPQKILVIFGIRHTTITREREKALEHTLHDYEYDTLYASSPLMVENTCRNLSLDQYDGFYCGSDQVMMGLYAALRYQGIDPHPKKIISYSDGVAPRFLFPNSPYLFRDSYEMGYRAASALLGKIKDNDHTSYTRQFIDSAIILPSI